MIPFRSVVVKNKDGPMLRNVPGTVFFKAMEFESACKVAIYHS